MPYEEIETEFPPTISLDKEGDSVEGIYLSERTLEIVPKDGTPPRMSKLYDFQDVDKKGKALATKFCMWGGRAVFDRKMSTLKEGDRVVGDFWSHA